MRRIILLLLIVFTSHAADASGDRLLFSTDFHDGIPSALRLSEGWRLDEMLIGQHGAQFSIEGGGAWYDYAYEVAFVPLAAGEVRFLVRSNPDMPCHAYHLVLADRPRLSRVSGAACEQETTYALAAEPLTLPPHQPAYLRIEVYGGMIHTFLNDAPLLSAEVGRTYPTGTAGLVLGNAAQIGVQAVYVRRLEGAPRTLQHYAGDVDSLIAELQAADVIPTDGRILFEEDFAYVRGGGRGVVTLAARAFRTNVAMGARLRFRLGNGQTPQMCGIAARVRGQSEVALGAAVSVQLFDAGEIVVMDRPEYDGDITLFETYPLGLDYSDYHYLLMILNGERLTVFVDGQLLYEDLPVVERVGVFALMGRGHGLDYDCEGRDIWVYAFD